MAGYSYPPSVLTAFALGPIAPATSAAAAGPVAGPHPIGLAPAGGEFFRSPAFGFLVLLGIFVYLHTRIL